MVAVIEQVDTLGRRSGLVSAGAGLMILTFMIAANTDVFSSQNGSWILAFLTWGVDNWLVTLVPGLLVLGSSYATGYYVAKRALLGFWRAFLAAIIAAYIDLLVGFFAAYSCIYFLHCFPKDGLLDFLDGFLYIFFLSALCAFIPIVVVALIRTIWLRKQLDHERILW